jgi:hypothetical protein
MENAQFVKISHNKSFLAVLFLPRLGHHIKLVSLKLVKKRTKID